MNAAGKTEAEHEEEIKEFLFDVKVFNRLNKSREREQRENEIEKRWFTDTISQFTDLLTLFTEYRCPTLMYKRIQKQKLY
ncbi:MAG: hypothetical protein WC139_08030 [Candidatus Kapaibacterium sp.]